jgi:2-amino-4-hydroxy-6-hydroxymethyldihydropteridine diphosphokinase
MTVSYIALGSNLGNPEAQLASAIQALGHASGCELIAQSPWYRSAAIGPGQQPDYLNAVAQLETLLSPRQLLHTLQAIEQAHGRERTLHWGARTLDLDILLYGVETISDTGLTIPHPRLQERNFVLYPLFDLAPELRLPCGTTIASLLARCPRQGLQLFQEK